MRFRLAVAVLGAALLALPAHAQHGGGGHGGGFGGHASLGVARPPGGFHGGGFGHPGLGRPGLGGHPGFGLGRPGFGFGHGFPNRGFYPWWGWGYPWWGWGYAYPWAWGYGWYDNSYYDNSYYAQPSANYHYEPDYYSQNSQVVQEQQAEIDRLNDEVASLREHEEDMRKSHQTLSSAAASQPTELVFRDKHTEEIQNYAIVGPTLWVLTAERARKIPLSDLDLSASKKANEDRGVEFDLPK